MDTPQAKKDDLVIGDIQVKTMPGSSSANPPSMKIPDSPPVPVAAVSQPAPKTSSPMMPGQASANSSLAQKISQQNNSPISPKVSNKKTISFILMSLLVVILGAGGYWYYAYGQTMLFARQIVLKLEVPYQNFVSNFDFTIDVKISKDNSSGDSNDQLGTIVADTGNFNISLKGLNHIVGRDYDGNAQIVVSADGFDFDNSLDYKQIGQDVYFKFNKEFSNELLAGFGLDVSEFFNKDRWLTYNWNDLSKLSNSDVGFIVNPNDFNLEKKLEERKKMDDYFKQFKLYEMFKIADTKEIKQSGEGQLKKFQLTIKPSKINDCLAMFMILNSNYLNNEELKTVQDIKNKIEQDLAQSRAANPEQFAEIEKIIQNMDFFIWVNNKTKTTQGVEMIWDNDAVELNGVNITLTGHFNFLLEIEEGHSISKPDQIITVQQAYENTVKKMEEMNLGIMKQYEEQNSADTDKDGLSDAIESFYGTDPLKPDTDGDGYPDGEEVNSGYNPLGTGKLNVPKL